MKFSDILTPTELSIGRALMNKGPYKYCEVLYKNQEYAKQMVDYASAMLKQNRKKKIVIHYDIDFDGIASGHVFRLAFAEYSGCSPDQIIIKINKERKHGATLDFIEEINTYDDVVLVVIVDSSSNEIELIKQLKTSCLIIDHHDLSAWTKIGEVDGRGQTQNGCYCVVSNLMQPTYLEDEQSAKMRIGGAEEKSAAVVVYELWHYWNKQLIESLYLEEWVAISLYSDVINTLTTQNLWFTDYLRNLRPNCDIRPIIDSLDIVEVHDGKECLTRNGISFQLVPLINSCMRLQCGYDIIETIRYRPHTIIKFKTCVIKQKQILEALMLAIKPQKIHNVVIAKLTKEISKRPANIMEIMKTGAANAALVGISDSILDGFKGLIATRLADEHNTAAFVYTIVNEDNKTLMKGSGRAGGKYADLSIREILDEKENWTATGHGDAFGFTYDVGHGTAEQMTSDVNSILANIDTINEHLRRFPVLDYNLLNNLANTANPETINDIIMIAELNNLKTQSDHYYFEIKPAMGFVEPEVSNVTSQITESTFKGAGLLSFTLRNYDGLGEYKTGKTYEIYLENSNGYNVLGTIQEITKT